MGYLSRNLDRVGGRDRTSSSSPHKWPPLYSDGAEDDSFLIRRCILVDVVGVEVEGSGDDDESSEHFARWPADSRLPRLKNYKRTTRHKAVEIESCYFLFYFI